jgi:hypothetical protein
MLDNVFIQCHSEGPQMGRRPESEKEMEIRNRGWRDITAGKWPQAEECGQPLNTGTGRNILL